jgi:hypothetical protein
MFIPKATLIFLLFQISITVFAQAPGKGWQFFSDPMGDKSYAYCAADGVRGQDFSYRDGKFIYDNALNFTQFGPNNINNYFDIDVKFKINGQITDLETYIWSAYPKYKQHSLMVAKETGKFLMVGRDMNYKITGKNNDGDDLNVDLAIMDNIKMATLVSVDYEGKRYYYQTTGFDKAIGQCKKP